MYQKSSGETFLSNEAFTRFAGFWGRWESQRGTQRQGSGWPKHFCRKSGGAQGRAWVGGTGEPVQPRGNGPKIRGCAHATLQPSWALTQPLSPAPQKYDYDSSTVRKKFFREALLQITIPFLLKKLAPTCKGVRGGEQRPVEGLQQSHKHPSGQGPPRPAPR